MQPASDKTFHLKWNNHLQNLSQLFTAIYSSSALADVTLACRDGALRAHKLVLSACSPYFEQIFKDNPCKHPVVILKGIPFSEINLLVEFMYKGSVDVQELDLQSLMHTASELEIRGLAYEVRANAAQLLNVNLEYPTQSTAVSHPSVSVASSSYDQRTAQRTDLERLKQIHMYQQSMLRESEFAKRKKREEQMPPNASAAVKSILAAAAKEMADGRERTTSCVQTEEGEPNVKMEMFHAEEETWSRPKKRVSFATPEDDEKIRMKKMQQEGSDDSFGNLRISAVTGGGDSTATGSGGIKVVNISALQSGHNDHNTDDDEAGQPGEDDDSCSSSGEEITSDTVRDSRPHVCDICDIRFQRASHLSRHRLTHTGERPFTCGGCGKSFARSDKLRVHTKICEREDPTVDMAESDLKSDVTSPGMVRITHKDSRQLMFTPSGDVMLPPRPSSTATPTTPVATATDVKSEGTPETPMKRGRGRPKKPVPEGLLPKVKKRRGRPPKAYSELEMMMGMGNGGLPSGLTIGPGVSGYPYDGSATAGNTVPMQQHITPSGQQLLVKRKRGRPPKNFFQPLTGGHLPEAYYDGSFNRNCKTYGRPKENYNATNLPFGDFSYLTEMMSYPNALYQHHFQNVTTVDPEQDVDMESPSTHNQSADSQNRTADNAGRRQDRTIDLSSSSSDDGTEDSRAEQTLEGEEIPAAVCETEVMTVGDCQILKLPPEQREETNGAPSENGKLSITPVTSVGDCTIRPVEPQADSQE